MKALPRARSHLHWVGSRPVFNIEVFNTCCQMSFFFKGGALYKNVPLQSLHQSQWRLLQELHATRYNGCNLQIETWLDSNLGTLADTSKFQYLLQFRLCNFDSALTATSARQAQLYVNVDFPNIIGWRVIAKVDWNLKHWMHWCECHYAVFRWKLWIGLEFLALGNRPKTGGLCLWSWRVIKCIM